MTIIKNQERKSEDQEMNTLKLLARDVCKITEDEELLWNEAILVEFFEKSGFFKIKYSMGEEALVRKLGNNLKCIWTVDMFGYLVEFLRKELEMYDVYWFLLGNYITLPQNVIRALKKKYRLIK